MRRIVAIALVVLAAPLWVSAAPARSAPKKQISAAAPSGSWLGVYVSGDRPLITDVLPNTPASRAGLLPGDSVMRIGNEAIENATELIATVSALKPGTSVDVAVARLPRGDDEPIVIRVVVEARPGPSEMLRRRFLGQPAPEFELPQIDGGIVSLADLRGEVVVVEAFATWCQVCKSTFQTLSELSDRGAVVLALSAEDRTVLEGYVASSPPPFAVLEDVMGRVQARFDARQVPLILVIDRAGVIRYIGVGGSIAELDRAFDAARRALASKTGA